MLRNRKYLKKITPYSMTKHFRTDDTPANPAPTPTPRPVVPAADPVPDCTPNTTQEPASIPTPEPRPAPMRLTPAPEPDMAPAPVPTTPTLSPPSPILRRSSRASNAPDRLEMSWGTKTYAQAVTGTDLCSLGISDSLHYSDPRGEGDITEYGCTEDSLAPASSSRQGPVCQIDVK